MPSSFLDVCRFNPTLGGTTDWTYSSAVTGYQSPAAAGAVNAAIYSYRAESTDLSQWEIGYGAYTSGTGVFARTTVLFNSSGTTSKINFSTVPQIAIVALGEDLASLVNANSFAGTQNVTNTTEATGAGTTAAAIFSGGVEILKKLFVTGVAKFTAAVAATNTTTGSVVVTGGIGTSGAIFSGGKHTATQLTATNDVASVSHVDQTTAYSVAAGATKTFAHGSGVMLIRDTTIHGAVAVVIYSSPAETVNIVSQTTSGPFVASSSPGAAQWGLYSSGGSLVIKNGGAGANSFTCFWIQL